MGLVYKIFATGKHKFISTMLYLAMGWAALIIIRPMMSLVPGEILTWIVGNGVAVSVGTAVAVSVGTVVSVGTAVAVGNAVAVSVAAGVFVGTGVAVSVGCGVGVSVAVAGWIAKIKSGKAGELASAAPALSRGSSANSFS